MRLTCFFWLNLDTWCIKQFNDGSEIIFCCRFDIPHLRSFILWTKLLDLQHNWLKMAFCPLKAQKKKNFTFPSVVNCFPNLLNWSNEAEKGIKPITKIHYKVKEWMNLFFEIIWIDSWKYRWRENSMLDIDDKTISVMIYNCLSLKLTIRSHW